jgi:hypothetical protein
MIPWVCTYSGAKDTFFGITLWATSEEQILEDYSFALKNLRIEGILRATMPYNGRLLRESSHNYD